MNTQQELEVAYLAIQRLETMVDELVSTVKTQEIELVRLRQRLHELESVQQYSKFEE